MDKIVFKSDEPVEGVFLIAAKSRSTFLNRKSKLEEITGFSDGGFNSFEEMEDRAVWKVITHCSFDSLGSLKKAILLMKRYNWFWLEDSTLMQDGAYLYCEGKWFNSLTSPIGDKEK